MTDLIDKPESIFEDHGPMKMDLNEFAKLHANDLDKRIAEFDQLEVESIENETTWEKIMFARLPLRVKSESQLVMILGIFGACSGALAGLDQSIISGAQYGIAASFNIPLGGSEMSLIASLMSLGAVCGSLIMTPLNHFFGRRDSLIISCLWYTLGGMMCAGARNVHMLYAARFFVGIGIGIEGGCVGIYISESVPPRIRGNLVSIYQLMIAFGEVLGYAADGAFFGISEGNWRYMLGTSVVFSTVLLIGLCFLPESPRWLVASGRVGHAWGVWKSLRDNNDRNNQLEFLELVDLVRYENEVSAGEPVWKRWAELFTRARNRRAFVFAFILVGGSQLCGVNGVVTYLSPLMRAAGFDERKSVLISMVGAGSLTLGTIPSVLFGHKVNRRAWINLMPVFSIGLIFLGVGYLYKDTDTTKAIGLILTGVVIYFLGYGGFATYTWIVPSEVQALRVRAQSMAICSACLYFWSWVLTYFFNRMQDAMTYTGLMIGFFGGIGMLTYAYLLLVMPETNGKTLEEIDVLQHAYISACC